MSKQSYQLVYRRYAPLKEFGGGFKGDVRTQASTSESVTYRTAAYVTFLEQGSNGKPAVSNNQGKSSGTHWIVGKGMPQVKVQTISFPFSSFDEQSHLFFFTSSSASNPLVPGSPDLDTQIAFGARWSEENLLILGKVTGDGFPNAEVYIKDANGKAILLVDYRTTSGATGPFHRLFGDGIANKLADFTFRIGLNKDRSFDKVLKKSPTIVLEPSLMPVPTQGQMQKAMDEFFNPNNWY